MACLAKAPAGRPASANELAERLRAIGPFDDWDDPRALAWWQEFQPQPVAETTELPTATITVDVGTRNKAA